MATLTAANPFKKATKARAKLRLALVGPSGSGKTKTAMKIARGLTGPAGRIALIDTEHGSAAKYSDEFDFDSVEMTNFDPRNYIANIQAAESAGYDAVIIDSLSHAWTGKGGALELVEQTAKRSKSGNKFTAWADVTPLHNALIEAMISCRCHVIATMRSKVEFIVENDANGRAVPRRVGMAPIQREGMDYEFDVQADMDHDHNFIVVKSRCSALSGKVISMPDESLGRTLAEWLSDGVEAPPKRPTLDAATVEKIEDLAYRAGYSHEAFLTALAKRGVSSAEQLDEAAASEVIAKLEAKVAANEAAANRDAREFGERLDRDHEAMAAEKEAAEPTESATAAD